MAARKVVAAEKWIEIKPIFLWLYLEENKSLDEVRNELASKYDFVASVKAFKSHINQWQAFKNYKAAEKEALVRQCQTSQFDRTIIPLHRGRPVKWDRVQRYYKDTITKSKTQSACSKVAPDPVSNVVINSHIRNVQPNPTHPDEYLLRTAKGYFEFQLFNSPILYGKRLAPRRQHRVWADLVQGLLLLETASRACHGWRRIHQACENLRSLISVGSLEVWEILLILADYNNSETHQILKAELLSFVKSMTVQLLPRESPLRRLTSSIVDLDGLKKVASPMVAMQFDILNPNVQSSETCFYCNDVRESVNEVVRCGNESSVHTCRDDIIFGWAFHHSPRSKPSKHLSFWLADSRRRRRMAHMSLVTMETKGDADIHSHLISDDFKESKADFYTILSIYYKREDEELSSIACNMAQVHR